LITTNFGVVKSTLFGYVSNIEATLLKDKYLAGGEKIEHG
jgi:hypothetical protein